MNAALIIENQQLQQENKQLSSLLKEYEQTLETVMAKFRSQAVRCSSSTANFSLPTLHPQHASQQHELTLTRHYETLLISREAQGTTAELTTSTAYSQSISRLSDLLRHALRSLNGEDPTSSPSAEDEPSLSDDNAPGYAGTSGREDWALEREAEVVRLELENEELRRLLGISNSSAAPPGAEAEDVRDWERPTRLDFAGMREMHHRKMGSTGSAMRPMGGGGGGGNGGGAFQLQRVPSLLAREREAANVGQEGGPIRMNPAPRFDIDEAPLHDAFKRP